MKVLQKIALFGLCALAGSYAYAQNENEPSANHGLMQHGTSAMSSQTPTELNRASKLIGTEVVNQQDHKLGVVRDLVIDHKSQRVAYAWVEKSDEAGTTGKYVAVPLNFFTPSTDQKNLVLNADKSRFSSAHGYAKNQMPEMSLTSTQLSFWQSIIEPSGAQPGTEKQKRGY